MRQYLSKGYQKGLGLFLIVLATLVGPPSWAQTDPIYINGPYYVGASENLQWYGNVQLGPLAEVYIEDGAKVRFYGASFKMDVGAKIYGARAGWTATTLGSGTGSILFQQPNPSNGTTVQQTLEGGSVYPVAGSQNTLTSIEIDNPSGVQLITNNTRVGTNITFTRGHLLLGTSDAVLAGAATITGYDQNKFVVTGGTGHLAHESYAGAFVYPVGRAVADYTPASINNTTANGFWVNVNNYATSTSVESGARGIDRTWNIYASSATGNSLINLQHNVITNQSAFITTGQYVSRYGATATNSTGNLPSQTPWQRNTGGAGVSPGTLTSGVAITGASERGRVYTDFAIGGTDAKSYFTKLSSPNGPDLKPTITAIPSDVIGVTAMELELSVAEINQNPTSGTITLAVMKSANWTVSSTVGTIINGWTYLGTPGAGLHHRWSSSVVLNASVSKFKVPITFDPRGATGQFTFPLTVLSGSGGDSTPDNNSDQDVITYEP